MKQPKLSDLKLNKERTLAMRKAAAKSKKVKITINFDSDILHTVKKLAKVTETPYQTLLNRIVRDSLKNAKSQESRLSRLEKEVKSLKKQLA